jgi:hypothetical protein
MSRCWRPEVFFDPVAWDGSDFVPGSAGDIDQRVLNNSIALGMLALCVWAAAGFDLGGQGLGICVALALGFVVARGCFWYGYYRALTLRLLGLLQVLSDGHCSVMGCSGTTFPLSSGLEI